MEYYNNILCISGAVLIKSDTNPDGIISFDNYKKLNQRGLINVVRRACYGKSALIEYSSLPIKYQEELNKLYGKPEDHAKIKPFKDTIKPDDKAVTYYSNYMLANGNYLEPKHQREYAINASILNSLHQIYTDATAARKAVGKSLNNFWTKSAEALNNLRAELKHSLPSKSVPLQRRYKLYIEQGYEALISKKFCNDNSRKVNDEIERIVMSLYVMKNKPFATEVHKLYLKFLAGEIKPFDYNTGEIINASEFIKNGKAIEICETTVWRVLNQPKNRIKVDKIRNGQHSYNNAHRPHHHRKAPEYAFSKISMDDRDLPRKCDNGKRVKAYYAYDVASGCVVGTSYSMFKDEELFIDCMQDMFRLIERNNLPMPLEVEVENHLVRKFFDDLALMFSFVRICNPGNSQEKHAEHLNRAKKYGVEKQTQTGVGRWWSKHEAYRVDRDKINDEFVEKTYTYERLVADDMEAIREFNNQLHPRQKKYPGKTRWQVLTENINPNAPQVSKPVVYKAIGEKVQTSLRRNQYFMLKGEKYQVSSINVIDKLEPGNYNMEVYFLRDSEGTINEVFAFQNGNFLCKATPITEYSTAKAEWVEGEDDVVYTEQSKYVSEFDAKVKQGTKDLYKIGIVKTDALEHAAQTEAVLVPVEAEPQKEIDNYDYDTTRFENADNDL